MVPQSMSVLGGILLVLTIFLPCLAWSSPLSGGGLCEALAHSGFQGSLTVVPSPTISLSRGFQVSSLVSPCPDGCQGDNFNKKEAFGSHCVRV